MLIRILIVTAAFAAAGLASAWSAFQMTQHPEGAASPGGDMWSHVEGPRKAWVPAGRMNIRVVSESSGLIKSRRYPGIFWTHGDSFNPAAIFAVRENGEVVARVNIAAPNTDWEDIAVDDSGFLYIGDIGNNLHWSMTRYVYKVSEPDPGADDGKTVTPAAVFSYTYPADKFDAEGLFVHDGAMHLVSRHDANRAKVYRLDPDAHNVLRLHEVAALRVERASGADVSHDGTLLAVCTTRDTWIYRIDGDLSSLDRQRPVFVRYPNDQVEGCCFDGGDLMLSNEKGEIFRVPAADIAAGVIFVPPAMLPVMPAQIPEKP